MWRIFTNYRADIFRRVEKLKDGSLLSAKEQIFSEIPIALWKSSKNFWSTELATETSKNSYEINLEARFSEIQVGDKIFVKNLGNFVIEQVILHHNHRGILDNVQAFISEIIL